MNNEQLLKEINETFRYNFKSIEDIPTKLLVPIYKKFSRWDDKLYCSCCREINGDDDRAEHEYYLRVLEALKPIVDKREHLPNAQERKKARQERGKRGRKR